MRFHPLLALALLSLCPACNIGGAGGGTGGASGTGAATGSGGMMGGGGSTTAGGTMGTGGTMGSGGSIGTGGTMGSGGSTGAGGMMGGGGQNGGSGSPCGLPTPADSGTAKGVIDLGHVYSLSRLSQSGDRVLSNEYNNNRWILWDTTTHTGIASGTSALSGYVAVQGNLAVVQTATGIELRSASTGQVQGTITGAPSSFTGIGIAEDGSYVWTALAGGGLEVWSPTGAKLVDIIGDYSSALIFAAPTELRVAKGPAGVDRIQFIPISGGTPTLSPSFPQPFHRWMEDGERFFAVVGTAVFIYSKQAALVESAVLPSLGHLAGTGNYYWTLDNTPLAYPLRVYEVGGGNTPVVTYSNDYHSTTKIFPSKLGPVVLPSGSAEVHFIHLSPQVGREVVSLPFGYFDNFALDGTTGSWTVANRDGVLYQRGTSQDPQEEGTLGCGAVLDIAGAPMGRAAVATASNQVLILDTNAGGSVEEVVPVWGEKVELSNDGAVLGTWGGFKRAQYLPDHQVRVFLVPGGMEVNAFPDARDFSLARGGTRVGYTEYPVATRHVMDISGMDGFFDDSGHTPAPQISPNGATIAVSDEDPVTAGPAAATYFYKAQSAGQPPLLVNAISGYAAGWIDDSRLLVYTYKYNDIMTYPLFIHDKTYIYDAQGTLLATTTLPGFDEFDVVSNSAVYSPFWRKIFDLNTGATLWTSPLSTLKSAAAGSKVVMAYENGVYAVPF